MPRPSPNEYPAFYGTYVHLVSEEDIVAAMQASLERLDSDLAAIPLAMQDHSYAVGKWTVRQLIQHAVDTERVFSYRALCIARGEGQPLPGFDEIAYAAKAKVAHRTLEEMTREFLTLRRSNVSMFKGFTEEMLNSNGTVAGKPVTVLAVGYMLIGHWKHHAAILRERYGFPL